MQGKILAIAALLLALSGPKSDWEYYQKNGHTSPKWDALVEAGFGAYEGGNTDAAVNFMERARGLGCKDGLLLYKLAMVQQVGGNTVQSIVLLEQAEPVLRNRYPKHPVTIGLSEQLGQLYFQQDKIDKALSRFQQALQAQGENFMRLYLVGQIYRMQKKGKEAVAYLEKALKYEAENKNLKLPVQMELMKLYYDSGDDDKALAMAEAILAQDAQNPTALSYRDQIVMRRYKAKERETMKRVLEKQ